MRWPSPVTAFFALTTLAGSASVADEIPIEGRYLQNRVCRGDQRDPAGLKVTITAQEISYSGGVCSIDSRRDEERKVIIAVTCRFKSGAVRGAEIAFTPLNDGSFHMTQQDGTFEADLHRCPG